MSVTLGEVAARVVGKIAPDLPCGIYFGLHEDAYHADVALGSGDIRRLATNPFDFWWKSRFNPYRKAEKVSHAMIFGRAVHTAVLEGVSKFRSLYAPTDFDGNTRAGIDEKLRIEKLGMTALKRDDYDQICVASTKILGNEHLADAFSGGHAEVSVFWERDGIKRKARLDFMKPRSNVDLKSIRNSREVDFPSACRTRFSQDRFYAQAEHYNEGRRAAMAFIRDGQVFGNVPADFISKIAATGEFFAFVYVFLQVDGSPLTWGLTLSPGNPILEAGRAIIEQAEANWRIYSDRFGLDTPWLLNEPPEEADLNDFPAWSFR